MADPLNPLDTSTLRPARTARGISRAKLADMAGIDHVTIWRIEKGKTGTSVEVWAKIVGALRELPITQAAA